MHNYHYLILTYVPDVGVHGGVGSVPLEFQVAVSYGEFSGTIWEPRDMCACPLVLIWIPVIKQTKLIM